jgi:hypothetical protein
MGKVKIGLLKWRTNPLHWEEYISAAVQEIQDNHNYV